MDNSLWFVVSNSADKFAYLQAQITVGTKPASAFNKGMSRLQFAHFLLGESPVAAQVSVGRGWCLSVVLPLVSDPLQNLWVWVYFYLTYLHCCILACVAFKCVLKAFGSKTVNWICLGFIAHM